MSSITKLLSENIIMSPPNNNNNKNKNMIYHESVFPLFISASIDSPIDNSDGASKGNDKKEDKKKQVLTSHLLSRNLHESSLYCDARRKLYYDVLANDKSFDRCQNQSASVEVCKAAWRTTQQAS